MLPKLIQVRNYPKLQGLRRDSWRTTPSPKMEFDPDLDPPNSKPIHSTSHKRSLKRARASIYHIPPISDTASLGSGFIGPIRMKDPAKLFKVNTLQELRPPLHEPGYQREREPRIRGRRSGRDVPGLSINRHRFLLTTSSLRGLTTTRTRFFSLRELVRAQPRWGEPIEYLRGWLRSPGEGWILLRQPLKKIKSEDLRDERLREI